MASIFSSMIATRWNLEIPIKIEVQNLNNPTFAPYIYEFPLLKSIMPLVKIDFGVINICNYY
jgi:hypothetical protein